MSGSMIKRKVDDRIKDLINDVANKNHRGVIILVGDRAKDQVVNLHVMISRANHNAKVSVLWCMKEDPDFGSTNRKLQERRARLEVKGGLSTEATKEAFQTFLAQTPIAFCKYKETHRILGQTFGMAILQDFEAITPNILARTIETVKGGGLIIFMFRGLRSLKQLYTIAMDVHSRYRTESQKDLLPRFNERFLLSLTDCDTSLCIDDDLNVLPITEKMKLCSADSRGSDYNADLVLRGLQKEEAELLGLKEKLKASAVVGPLVQLCQTKDQAKTVLSLMQSVSEKNLDATCVVTAARGRGKTAALGMAAAGAIGQGYSNILCTAPSPENVQTFFEFLVRSLKEMGYTERTDFEVMQSTSEEFSKCIIRVNVFRDHRQTVQFVSPNDSHKFAQAELAIIDEAAALPLPLVKSMLGPYLVFLASTVSGYEGTGRSLSMKLVSDMRKYSGTNGPDGRILKEMSMEDPIRYGPNDPVERWLSKLLCLEATEKKTVPKSCPHPSACELFYVNRDALFSYHPLAENLLHTIFSLLAAAHYKNQPNDLQLLSDAPGHHLFILCPENIVSAKTSANELPDVFCVIHACEEGQISSESIRSNLSRGLRPSGDLIPYTLSQYYLEEGFAKLAGLRIVRIATNPELQRAGYGSRALELLKQYFNGNISYTAAVKNTNASPTAKHGESTTVKAEEGMIKPREKIPSLLVPLAERPYEPIEYLGVSFGLTMELYNFWKRNGFDVLYIRQSANEITGENSSVMVHPFGFDIRVLQLEFRRRFLSLLSMPFRCMRTDLALSVSTVVNVHDEKELLSQVDTSAAGKGNVLVGGVPQLTHEEVNSLLNTSDLRRLKLNSTAFIEGGIVLDLIPKIARLYFEGRLHYLPNGTQGVVLPHAQAAVLLALGLQCLTLEDLARQPLFSGVPVHQLRSFFQKSIARVVEHLDNVLKIKQNTSKRPREETDEKKEEKDGASTEEAEEIEQKIYDKNGNLVGLSVAKKTKKTVNVDRTLLHDARSVTTGEDPKVHKSLQEVFYRKSKKGKRK